MSKSISLTYHLSKLLSSSSSSLSLSHFPSSRTFSFYFSFSSSSTRYPLQYDLIINRPPPPPVRPNAKPEPDQPEPAFESDGSELKLDSWVDRKLAEPGTELDKSKRKYYNKRRKRMYGGSDSDDDESIRRRQRDEELIELKPEVVEFPTLHKREEELHFYDAFAYPWEKDKHYRMVYQLEKKYFPDQCLDNAFLQPGEKQQQQQGQGKERKKMEKMETRGEEELEDKKKMVFFEGKREENEKKVVEGSRRSKEVSEKKVEEFFKGLKKKEDNGVVVVGDGVEPFFSSRRTGLPPVWDSPHGTVLLINKPKGKVLFEEAFCRPFHSELDDIKIMNFG